MIISKIQPSTNFGHLFIKGKYEEQPLPRNIQNVLGKMSEKDDVTLYVGRSFEPSTQDTLEVSVRNSSPDSKYKKVAVYLNPTEENASNRAIASALKKVVNFINS